MNDFNEYADLGSTGYASTEPLAPEDEFFHALYIAGNSRQNHIGVTEEAGKLQIRGVEYNLDNVNMIITHVKKILVKTGTDNTGKQKTMCFSYKTPDAPPWKGWEGRTCGTNSAERAANQWCSTCREQILLAGIYCDDSGVPVKNEAGKNVFIFLRGKGMKYSNVSQYLADMYKMDVTNPLFTPVTRESTEFEKKAVNNKRHVTKIGIDKVQSKFGIKDVFTLTPGTPLDNKSIFSILKIAKSTLDDFNEKFDWSKPDSGQTTGYAPQQESTPQVDQSNVIPDVQSNPQQQTPQEQAAPQQQAPQQQFNFEDINF